MRSKVDVAVVGAGVAGLACATLLESRGLTTVVLERDHAVGGRVRTDEVDGFLLDRGFQVLPTSYPEAQRLLDLDRLDLRPFTTGAIVRREGRFHRVVDPRRMPVRALRSLAGGTVSPRDAAGVATLLRSRRETTIAEALRSAPLSAPARDAFLTPFLRGITLERGLETSSEFLRFVLRAFAGGRAAIPARGMRAIPEQLAEGLDVRLGVPVRAVGPGTVTMEGGTSLDARAVVVATAGLVDDAVHDWNGVACVYFAAPEAPLPGPWLVLDGEGDGPVNNLCVPSEAAASYAPAGKALVSATVLGDREPDLEAVAAQLGAWFGRATARWSHLATVRVPHALPRYPVGGEPAPSPRLAPGLYACGDHREHPSLNGALHSGRRAADAVLADLA
jgi:phytoene dehydrogenase-like protein